MSHKPITLYCDRDFFSPYAMSAFVSLTEKGIAFTTRDIDLSCNQQQSPEYDQVSFTHRVPTLVVDDFGLSESSAISEYLEEQFAPPGYAALYPSSVQERAKARELQAWLRSDLLALRQERPTEVVFGGMKCAPLSASAKQAADKLIAAASRLLSPGRESLFSTWCIADTDLALMLNRLALHGDTLPDELNRYAGQQWCRPSVQSWLANHGRNR